MVAHSHKTYYIYFARVLSVVSGSKRVVRRVWFGGCFVGGLYQSWLARVSSTSATLRCQGGVYSIWYMYNKNIQCVMCQCNVRAQLCLCLCQRKCVLVNNVSCQVCVPRVFRARDLCTHFRIGWIWYELEHFVMLRNLTSRQTFNKF